MTRRDPISSETDRPHFYSQFWVDVAGGKRDLTASHVEELEAEPGLEEDEEFGAAAPEVSATRPAPKKPEKPVKERKPEPVRPTITSLADLANIDLLMKNSAAMEGEEVPDLETGTMGDLEPFEASVAPATDFDVDLTEEPEAEAAESYVAEDEDFGNLEYDEDEEEDEWSGGRKPGKQSKQQKRRDRRTNF